MLISLTSCFLLLCVTEGPAVKKVKNASSRQPGPITSSISVMTKKEPAVTFQGVSFPTPCTAQAALPRDAVGKPWKTLQNPIQGREKPSPCSCWSPLPSLHRSTRVLCRELSPRLCFSPAASPGFSLCVCLFLVEL